MAEYQFFAGPAGALRRVSVDARCYSDEQALIIAARLTFGENEAEVWQGIRFVCRVVPPTTSRSDKGRWPASR